MIKKLINGRAASIASAAFILALATLASKVLGIYRNRILAGEFGAGNELDIYYAAFRIPDLIFNIVVLGALSAGFIPVFTRFISEKKENQAFYAANAVLNLLFLLVIPLCLISIIFAPSLIGLIAPGFDDAKRETTVQLTRIMFLSPIFLLLSSVMGGVLQSFQRFFIYSLSPVMYNIGIIIGAIYFEKWWGLPGLAWGVALGSFLHFAIQLPMAIKLGFRYKFIIDPKDQGAGKIIKMMVPRTLTLIANQLNFLIITAIASTLAVGSLAIFNLANDLQSFPIGLFAISFAIASFPTFSSLAGQENKDEFIKSLIKTTRLILFFIIPISLLFIVLRAQIVRVALGTGEFDWHDTVLALNSLGIFSLSLFAQSVIPLFSRAFWALGNARIPFLTSLAAAASNLGLAIFFSERFGIEGLVGAFSISSIINAVLLYYLINKKIGLIYHQQVCKPVLKIIFVSAAAGLFSYIALYAIEPFLSTNTGVGILLQGSFAGLIGILVYCFLGWLYKIEEFIILKNALRRRMFKSKFETAEIISEE